MINVIYRKQPIDNVLEIHRFYIDKDYRGKNIGEQVIEYITKLAKDCEYNGVVAKVYCDNPAISFYERNNFETYYRYMIKKI